jgi:hypothetical protein
MPVNSEVLVHLRNIKSHEILYFSVGKSIKKNKKQKKNKSKNKHMLIKDSNILGFALSP